jgi:hypothetical protein
MSVSMNLRVRKKAYFYTALGLAFSINICWRYWNREEEKIYVNPNNRKYFLYNHSTHNYSWYKLTRGIFAERYHHYKPYSLSYSSTHRLNYEVCYGDECNRLTRRDNFRDNTGSSHNCNIACLMTEITKSASRFLYFYIVTITFTCITTKPQLLSLMNCINYVWLEVFTWLYDNWNHSILHISSFAG